MKTSKSTAKTALKPNAAKTAATTTPSTTSAVLTKSATPAPKAATPLVATPPVVTASLPVKATTPEKTVATIDVKLDVGFGNAVYVRGQGSGLTWDHGVPLVCLDGKTWRWSGEVKDPVTFKVLINDNIWSAGNDLTVKPGQKLEIAPQFA